MGKCKCVELWCFMLWHAGNYDKRVYVSGTGWSISMSLVSWSTKELNYVFPQLLLRGWRWRTEEGKVRDEAESVLDLVLGLIYHQPVCGQVEWRNECTTWSH